MKHQKDRLHVLHKAHRKRVHSWSVKMHIASDHWGGLHAQCCFHWWNLAFPLCGCKEAPSCSPHGSSETRDHLQMVKVLAKCLCPMTFIIWLPFNTLQKLSRIPSPLLMEGQGHGRNLGILGDFGENSLFCTELHSFFSLHLRKERTHLIFHFTDIHSNRKNQV